MIFAMNLQMLLNNKVTLGSIEKKSFLTLLQNSPVMI